MSIGIGWKPLDRLLRLIVPLELVARPARFGGGLPFASSDLAVRCPQVRKCFGPCEREQYRLQTFERFRFRSRPIWLTLHDVE